MTTTQNSTTLRQMCFKNRKKNEFLSKKNAVGAKFPPILRESSFLNFKKKNKKTHMWTFPTFPATTSEFVPQKSQIFTIPFTFNNISEQATRAIGSAEGINSLLSAPEFSGKKHRFPDICRYAYRKNADMEETWHKSRFDFLYPITIISFIQAWWYMISFIPALLKKTIKKNDSYPTRTDSFHHSFTSHT